MANHRLVVGYGNPLRADDGLGWVVAEELAESPLPSDTRVLTAHQLTPELAEPVGQADLVVFVDAREGGEPGRIERDTAAPAAEGSPAFSHDLDPPALLALARSLYGHCPRAVVVSVGGQDFGYGMALSEVVWEAVPAVVQEILTILEDGAAGAVAVPVGATTGSGRRSLGG